MFSPTSTQGLASNQNNGLIQQYRAIGLTLTHFDTVPFDPNKFVAAMFASAVGLNVPLIELFKLPNITGSWSFDAMKKWFDNVLRGMPIELEHDSDHPFPLLLTMIFTSKHPGEIIDTLIGSLDNDAIREFCQIKFNRIEELFFLFCTGYASVTSLGRILDAHNETERHHILGIYEYEAFGQCVRSGDVNKIQLMLNTANRAVRKDMLTSRDCQAFRNIVERNDQDSDEPTNQNSREDIASLLYLAADLETQAQFEAIANEEGYAVSKLRAPLPSRENGTPARDSFFNSQGGAAGSTGDKDSPGNGLTSPRK